MNHVAEIGDQCSSHELVKPAEASLYKEDIHVARQPIFDRHNNVFAYELLFRSGKTNEAVFDDGNKASSQVIINAFIDVGFRTISSGRPAFLNLTEDFIVGKIPMPLPPEFLVIEVLEDIDATDEVIDALNDFMEQGYTIALDDYVLTEDKEPFFDVVDIVKVDVLDCDYDDLAVKAKELKGRGIKLLAEKVETHEDYEKLRDMGFDYFQGYYFSKPKIYNEQTIKPNRLAVLRLLAMLQDKDCQFAELEQIICQDVSMSYKVLRIVNSALYNIQREITSIRQAIVALGLNTIKEWLLIIVFTDIKDKPEELLKISLQRARMMHSLAEISDLDVDACFTAGLFSSIDALMDQPMDEIIKQLPLSNEIVSALIVRDGKIGKLLQIVIDFEQGKFGEAKPDEISTKTLSPKDFQHCYLESIAWSNELMANITE